MFQSLKRFSLNWNVPTLSWGTKTYLVLFSAIKYTKYLLTTLLLLKMSQKKKPLLILLFQFCIPCMVLFVTFFHVVFRKYSNYYTIIKCNLVHWLSIHLYFYRCAYKLYIFIMMDMACKIVVSVWVLCWRNKRSRVLSWQFILD